ncbi:hypothetical protein KIPB_007582, partial [Kipferlia bialata]
EYRSPPKPKKSHPARERERDPSLPMPSLPFSVRSLSPSLSRGNDRSDALSPSHGFSQLDQYDRERGRNKREREGEGERDREIEIERSIIQDEREREREMEADMQDQAMFTSFTPIMAPTSPSDPYVQQTGYRGYKKGKPSVGPTLSLEPRHDASLASVLGSRFMPRYNTRGRVLNTADISFTLGGAAERQREREREIQMAQQQEQVAVTGEGEGEGESVAGGPVGEPIPPPPPPPPVPDVDDEAVERGESLERGEMGEREREWQRARESAMRQSQFQEAHPIQPVLPPQAFPGTSLYVPRGYAMQDGERLSLGRFLAPPRRRSQKKRRWFSFCGT